MMKARSLRGHSVEPEMLPPGGALGSLSVVAVGTLVLSQRVKVYFWVSLTGTKMFPLYLFTF